jgi:hypothetical protein
MHRLCNITHAALLALLLLLPGVSAADEQKSGDSVGEGATADTQPDPDGTTEDPDSDSAAEAAEPTDSSPPREPQTRRAAQTAPDKSAVRRRTRLVYSCHDSSVPVFSDRPCSADAYARRIDLPPPSMSGAAPSTRPATPDATTRPIAAVTPRDERPRVADRCARLENQLAAIDARMREGYSAREAARIWQRWREAKAKLRAERC